MSDQFIETPLRRHVADVLRRARKLPVGPDRNDLRQLAVGLLWLHRKGRRAPSIETCTFTDDARERPGDAVPDGQSHKSRVKPSPPDKVGRSPLAGVGAPTVSTL